MRTPPTSSDASPTGRWRNLVVLLLTTFLVIHSDPSDAAKILLVPANINSHALYFTELARSLATLGHTCHVLAASNARLPSSLTTVDPALEGRLTVGNYLVDGDDPFSSSPEMSETMIKIALTPSIITKFQILLPFWQRMLTSFNADCERLLANSSVVDEVRLAGYDLSIMDPAFGSCYVLPYSIGLRFASLSVPFAALSYRVPRLPSFVSPGAHSDRMSFLERLSSFLHDILMSTVLVQRNAELTARYAPGRPPIDVHEITAQSSFWLYLEELSVNYARPLMPNTVPVGDLMAGRPGRPLPTDLERFVAGASADAGVVVVSFGSYLDDVPPSLVRQFCEAFQLLPPGFRVVWKLKTKPDCASTAADRVLTLNWIPQNDLLADARTRVFVTHGGLNSVVEAVYHAKPLVALPISLDQPANAAAVEHRGFGVQMDIATDPDRFAGVLAANIRRVASDPSFAERARHLSAIMRDKPETAGQRASRMIDHVIKHGDAHLRTGAFDLSVWQFIMFDIFAFLFIVCIIALLIILLIARAVVVVCRRCCCGAAKNTAKTKTKSD